MSKPTLECIAVKDVHDYARTTLAEIDQNQMAPISLSRARAWQSNPHAAPDDVALIVAKQDGKLKGYLGLMPAKLKYDDQVEKVHWLSTFFVPENERDSGLGAMLLMRAIGLQQNLAACGSSDMAIKTYRALRFNEPQPLKYFQFDAFRKNYLGAPFRAARKLIRKASPTFRGLDGTVDACNSLNKKALYQLLQGSTERHDITTRELESFSEVNFEEALDTRHPSRFLRDTEVMDWMVQEPWCSTDKGTRQPNYYFDDYREHFEYRILEVQRQGTAIGFVVVWLLKRDEVRDARVLDYHFEDPADCKTVFQIAVENAAQFGADRVIVPDICQPQIEQSKWAAQWFEAKQRECFVRPRSASRELGKALERFSLHYCDGDIPFA